MTSPMRAQIHGNRQRFGKVYEQCFEMIKKSIEEHGCKLEITFVEHERIKDLEEELDHAMVVQSEKDQEILSILADNVRLAAALERIKHHQSGCDMCDGKITIAREVMGRVKV